MTGEGRANCANASKSHRFLVSPISVAGDGEKVRIPASMAVSLSVTAAHKQDKRMEEALFGPRGGRAVGDAMQWTNHPSNTSCNVEQQTEH
jgi:hypothetical protein